MIAWPTTAESKSMISLISLTSDGYFLCIIQLQWHLKSSESQLFVQLQADKKVKIIIFS